MQNDQMGMIAHRAWLLVREAEELGLVLEIHSVPLSPLAMGHTESRVEVREHLAVFRRKQAETQRDVVVPIAERGHSRPDRRTRIGDGK